MSSCDSCSRVPYGLFQMTGFMLLCGTITLLIIVFNMHQIWRSDWENSRCGLSVLPFANYINPNVSTLDNFNYCVKKKTDPMIRAYTKYKLDKAAAKAKLENERAQKELEKTKEIVDTTVEETKSRFSGLYEMYDRMVRIMEYSSHSIQNFFTKLVLLYGQYIIFSFLVLILYQYK